MNRGRTKHLLLSRSLLSAPAPSKSSSRARSAAFRRRLLALRGRLPSRRAPPAPAPPAEPVSQPPKPLADQRKTRDAKQASGKLQHSETQTHTPRRLRQAGSRAAPEKLSERDSGDIGRCCCCCWDWRDTGPESELRSGEPAAATTQHTQSRTRSGQHRGGCEQNATLRLREVQE